MYSVSVVDSNGCSGNASIFINRGIGPPSITVSLDTLEGAPCDHIVFPIRIDTSKNMPPSGATDYVAVITFNESLLAPVDNSLPSVIIDSANHRWRTITLRGVRPDAQVDGILMLANAVTGVEFAIGLGDTIATR